MTEKIELALLLVIIQKHWSSGKLKIKKLLGNSGIESSIKAPVLSNFL